MKTEIFWQTVSQMADITCSSAKLMVLQGQSSEAYEREQIQLLKAKCERRLRVIDEEVALNRGNGLKPGCDDSCEEQSHLTLSPAKITEE
ncbi:MULTISPECIES: hypothetical protein [Vibrio]|uniref:hypothetical protein n=1 Tax=Vibrio TaxID=662 RepID=UPI001EED7ABC|nr:MULTISPECIES: hypothetical protein [Vibrio]EKA7364703.1 hypothetical protein [Vibrio parahaemolyticus]EJL6927687.1 hypothetical protein [Vibrio alginolyticus]ELB1514053.1 hypothetical protein [Vibrio alginolyticus]ELB2279479.1 hypothetical protein [Vibrio alginolyticus]MCS0140311.1 hypothetical protein [Vibrio alginolyticus]